MLKTYIIVFQIIFAHILQFIKNVSVQIGNNLNVTLNAQTLYLNMQNSS